MGIHIVKLEGRESGNVLPLATVAPKIKEELLNKALEERFTKWVKTDLRRKNRVDVKVAGVVFKPEDSKEGYGECFGGQVQSLRTAPRA